MTDKEQIIIDVNKHFKKATNNSGQPITFIINYADLYEAIIQLNEEFIKKVQEYERLKKDYFKQNEWLQQRAKECEALKSELYLYKTWYRAKHGDIKNLLGSYRKALEEIEVYSNTILKDYLKYSQGCINITKKIKDIINKIKE